VRDRPKRIAVLGIANHPSSRRTAPHLGHGTEYVLEHARQTVAVVAFPIARDNDIEDENDT
jgi:hypothetical protein